MINLKTLLEALHEDCNLSSAEEIKRACELIIEVQEMSGGERDCIFASYENGPLFDGDIPSKTARDTLLNKKYMAKVVVKGEEGYNACTYKGSRAYKLFKAGI